MAKTAAEKAAAKAAKAEQAVAAKAAEKAAATSEKDLEKTKKPHVYRTDMGESLP